jgi:hypothetical protein
MDMFWCFRRGPESILPAYFPKKKAAYQLSYQCKLLHNNNLIRPYPATWQIFHKHPDELIHIVK